MEMHQGMQPEMGHEPCPTVLVLKARVDNLEEGQGTQAAILEGIRREIAELRKDMNGQVNKVILAVMAGLFVLLVTVLGLYAGHMFAVK